MGPQAAINAVFYNQLQAIDDPTERARRTEELRREYAEDIDILHLASELVVDAVIQPEDLRDELVKRFALRRGQGARLAAQAQPDHAGVALVGPSRNVSPEIPGADHRVQRPRPSKYLRYSVGSASLPDGAGIPGFPA